ncbi:MAG: hypothetical protein EPO58_07765 [Chitinophagaceae bacterium]|nr:hypothetical protein [Bacteroidota bacterium]TAJ55258.1 MAG: hypothetical protein EPO58_07765 [Chitinophagaceae bacterium]
MKHVLLLSAISLTLFTGCSTAFKAGQTPDDVYFSPGREVVQDEKVQQKQKAEYQEYVSSMDDRYLRMKIAKRYRWSSIDNFDYWYDSRYDFGNYNYQYYSGLNPYWNPRLGYGGAYYPGNYGWGWSSPVYTVVHYYTIPTTPGGYTSGSNILAYRNKSYNNDNYGYRDPKTGGFVPSSGSSNFGSLLKRVFSGSGTANAYSYDRPARTFSNTTPSSNNPTRSVSTPSSNAGGTSGGFNSTGTSTSTGRGGRG